MNDTLEKSAGPSLAVVEKKPQRHGGCVGIFFQLFDWKRRFAKKKLFSKKLLPPADRLTQSSKKFGGDEKQPRIRLIADENKGGFPNGKNTNGGGSKFDVDQKHEMRVPGLVARLMGLETMPALHRDKLKKAPSRCSSSEKFVEMEELSVKKGGAKHELRPPKLQKTSGSERQAVAKFGVEKLPPFKNVLSKTRKHHHHHHHPKLPTPVKSPRNGSRKSSSSRLIGAAARILEPGLQTSRSKSTLTYLNPLDRPTRNVAMESEAYLFPRQQEVCEGLCKNCGYVLNDSDSKPIESERPVVFASSVSQCVGTSCHGPEITKPGCSFFGELEDESCEGYPGLAASEMNNVQPRVMFTPYKIPLSEQGMPMSFGSNRSGNQVLHSRDDLISGKELRVSAGNGIKNMIRVPARRDSSKFNSEKRIPNRVNDTVPPGRKRRPGSISRHGESSTVDAQIYGFPQSVMGKQPVYNAHLINRQRSRNRSTADHGLMSNNAVSFAHSSPVKLKSEVAERKVKNDVHFAEGLQQSASGEQYGRRKRLEKPVPLSGDALGTILEQKLKELTCQGGDIGGGVPKKTTAVILHELISALTSGMPFPQQDNSPSISDGRNVWHSCGPLPVTMSSKKSQASAMASKPYVDQQLESEHLSPGSVLEAYFSTESCPSSSSMDDCHGYKTLTESIECSYDRQRWPNSVPLDSAASIKRPESSKELVIDVLNNVSETLCCSKLENYGLNGSDLELAKEVLTNAELALHCVAGRASPLKLIRGELEALASILWMNFGRLLGIEDGKEANQLTRFVFDSVIEYLGSSLPKMGKGQPRANGKTLMFEIVEAVRKWEEMSEFGLDEVIEREMDRSLGEWTRCECEVVGTGVEISRCLYNNLVDEVVMDLSRLGC